MAAGAASQSLLPASLYDQQRQDFLADGPEELQRLWSKFAETRDAAISAAHVSALHAAEQAISPFQAGILRSDFRSAFCFSVTDALDGYLEEPSAAALEEVAAAAVLAKPVADWHSGQEAAEVTAGLLQLLRRDTQRMRAAAAAGGSRTSSDCATWDARLAREIQQFAERHLPYFVYRLLPFASGTNFPGTAAVEKFVSALSGARGLCAKDAWGNVALAAETCIKSVFEVHVSYLRHSWGCLRALGPLLDLGGHGLLPLHLHAALSASITRCGELSAEAAAAGAALREESTGFYFGASPLKGFTETWLNGQLSDLLGTLVPVLASRGITSAAAAAGVSEQVWRETQGQAVDRLLDRVSALQGQNKAHERQLAACEAARQADNAACEAARQADSASVHQKLDAMLAHFSKQEAAHSKLEAVLAEHGAALAALPAHVKAVGAQETHKVIAFVCTAIVDLNAGVLAQVAGLVAPAPTAAAAAAAQDGAIPSPGSENLRTNGRGTDSAAASPAKAPPSQPGFAFAPAKPAGAVPSPADLAAAATAGMQALQLTPTAQRRPLEQRPAAVPSEAASFPGFMYQ